MSLGRKQGAPVKLTLSTADASGGVFLVVSDENGVDRPVQSYERLVLDSMIATVASAAAPLTVTDPGTGVNETLLLTFSTTATDFHTDGEGLSLSLGSTPRATATAAGVVALVGTGRVIQGSTAGPRANYKELLTPGGNISGH